MPPKMADSNGCYGHTPKFTSGARPLLLPTQQQAREGAMGLSCPFTRKKQNGPKTVNIFLGFFFIVNFCLGTGFLGVPFSFFNAGFVAAIPTLLLIAFISWNNSEWELETMARAQAIISWRESESERETLIQDQDNKEHPRYEIELARKFEPTELCEIFLTRWGKYAYMIILSLYCFLAGWSFTTVAGSAWATNIPFHTPTVQQCEGSEFYHAIYPEDPSCWHAYQLCVFFFAVIVVPLSLVDLKEQAILQMILGVLRFSTIAIIVVYCIVKLSGGDNICTFGNSSNATGNNSLSQENLTGFSDLSKIVFQFDWKGWLVSIPVFTYAFIIHQGIPALTHPIKEKHLLRQLMIVMFGSAALCYLALGIVVPLWFKATVLETVTLNWAQTAVSSQENWAIRALSYYLVLFPSIDVCSAYPLIVHTISNNIYTVLFGRDTSHEPKHPRLDCLLQFVIKLSSALLPIVAALFISNLVYVLKYAGLMGFFICFFFPTALQLSSIRVCSREFGNTLPPFENKDDKSGDESPPPSEGRNRAYHLMNGSDMSKGKATRKSLCQSSACYTTPYSNRVLSHPITVGVIGVTGVVLFLLAVCSLAVHPKKIYCNDEPD